MTSELELWLLLNATYPVQVKVSQAIIPFRFDKQKAEMINDLEYLQISKENSNSHRRCSIKTGVLRNFAEFPGKHLCQRLFVNKVESARLETLSKKSL